MSIRGPEYYLVLWIVVPWRVLYTSPSPSAKWVMVLDLCVSGIDENCTPHHRQHKFRKVFTIIQLWLRPRCPLTILLLLLQTFHSRLLCCLIKEANWGTSASIVSSRSVVQWAAGASQPSVVCKEMNDSVPRRKQCPLKTPPPLKFLGSWKCSYWLCWWSPREYICRNRLTVPWRWVLFIDVNDTFFF